MTREDTEKLIISILEKGPNTPENIWNEIKKYENLARPTFYRYWRKLKNQGIIRELTKNEMNEYSLRYSKKRKYYILTGYSIEEKKGILLEALNSVNIKNIDILLGEIENYLNFLNKPSEYMEFLEFYGKMKEILDLQSFENNLMKYDDYFIIVVNNLISKYKNSRESKINPFEESYMKAVEVASQLFEDFLNLFNKGANQPEIIFPIFDMLYEMNKLTPYKLTPNYFLTNKREQVPVESLLTELEKREKIAENVIKKILVHYLKYDEKNLKDNLKFIKEKSKFHYKKYLENNSPRDKMLSDIYDQILKEFKYYG
ncbi:MAG: hypothetical protein ACP5IB_07595 [Thermoplasmata archaeon]